MCTQSHLTNLCYLRSTDISVQGRVGTLTATTFDRDQVRISCPTLHKHQSFYITIYLPFLSSVAMDLNQLACIMNRTKISVLNKTRLLSLQIINVRSIKLQRQCVDIELGIICIYLVRVGRDGHGSVCWGPEVLREWGMDKDYCGVRGEGRFQDRSLPQGGGAAERSPQSLHQRHLGRTTNQRIQTNIHNIHVGTCAELWSYLPCHNHHPPCLCPQQAESSWRKWECFHRSAPHSSRPPDFWSTLGSSGGCQSVYQEPAIHKKM